MGKNDPYLDRAMRGWLIRTATKNFWRVADWYDLDDLIQDGYLCYYKCYRKYRHLTELRHPRQEDKRRFMALVQATFTNHITNLANSRTQTVETPLSNTELTDVGVEAILKEPEDVTARLMLHCAPAEIKALMEMLAQEGYDTVKYLRTRLKRGRKTVRETTNENLCRRIGLNYTVNLYDMFREHFGMVDQPIGRYCGASFCCW